MYNSYEEYEEARRRAEWNRKIARMRREKELALKRRRILIKVGIPTAIMCFAAIVTIVLVNVFIRNNKKYTISIESKSFSEEEKTIGTKKSFSKEEILDLSFKIGEISKKNTALSYFGDKVQKLNEAILGDVNPSKLFKNEISSYEYKEADNMDFLSGENMQSTNAILVNLATDTIEGQKDYKARIVPASMTKVMTLLVAVKNIESIKDTVAITTDATDFSYSNDCSSVGFAKGEVVTIEDLIYGTILSSGGDAATQLALYVAGSQEKFVEMMNEECKRLGISETTHFTNAVGIYDDNLYSTCYDMAVIMKEAMNNEFCKEVMSAKKYTTSQTTEHPDGIPISNWFLRRIEDKDCGGEVLCAKTGFVVQSGNCAVSYGESATGTPYICVTANAHSGWRCIYDHVDIYKNHTK